MEECFTRGSPSWSYLSDFGSGHDDAHHHVSVRAPMTIAHESGTVTAPTLAPTESSTAPAAAPTTAPTDGSAAPTYARTDGSATPTSAPIDADADDSHDSPDDHASAPRCLCANPNILLGFVDDPDYDTYSLAGTNRMPENYLDAEVMLLDPDMGDFYAGCQTACLKKNSSAWYSVWNSFGTANYADSPEYSRCRCSDPDPGDSKLSTQLVEDPGYDTWSLAGPQRQLRPFHKIDGFDLEDDECIRHCSTVSPGSTWVALWNAFGELNGAMEGILLSREKRCLCEDTTKEYAIDKDPSYDLYSLRGEC